MNERTEKVDLTYTSAPYSSIDDASVKYTQSDIEKYYDSHKLDFDQKASRDIDYVVFLTQFRKRLYINENKVFEKVNVFLYRRVAINIINNSRLLLCPSVADIIGDCTDRSAGGAGDSAYLDLGPFLRWGGQPQQVNTSRIDLPPLSIF